MKEKLNLKLEKKYSSKKQNKIWKKVVGILSCIVMIITIYLLSYPAITLNEETSYTLSLIDNYVFEWKTDDYITNYNLDLYFMDTENNYIEGKNVIFEIKSDGLVDSPYGFGYVPYKDSTLTDSRGQDLISALNLKQYTSSTGAVYEFDHAEVLVGDTWYRFTDEGMRWHIWCKNASTADTYDENGNIEAPTDYGWRGNYGESNTEYTIDSNTKYKLVYKEVRYGINDTTSVESLGSDSGITFKIFNYSGDNSQIGTNNINNNGVYNYFTFRGVPGTNNIDAKINSTLDGDGFNNDTRVKILSTLQNGYPVFNCQDQANCTDFSLGYLFGAEINPNGETVRGIERYNPTNTLLQIDESGYYYYDSNSNAVDYDTTNNRFMLRNYVERAQSLTTYEKEESRYEFRPFNYWNDFKTEKTNTSNERNYNYETSEVDNWYGMTMEFSFYMPKEGKINGQDMIFTFSGDDDVWVFIDDVLVLDLGGTHGAVDGAINFATGAVNSYLNWNGTKGTTTAKTANSTNIYQMFSDAKKTDNIVWSDNAIDANKTFANYTEHTIKFFYLERGGSVANCQIKFNMPVLPSGTLTVQKQFEGTDNYNEDHGFTLYDTTSGINQPVANAKYTINGVECANCSTDANGYFTLKANQAALFKLVNEHSYYVAETKPGAHAEPYSCILGTSPCKSVYESGEFTIEPESAYIITFTNKIKTYDLNISKIVEYDTGNTDTFEFSLSLKDKDNLPVIINDDINSPAKYTVNKDTGIVTIYLKHGDNIKINDIPVDTSINLQETKHDGYQVIIKSEEIAVANGDTYVFSMDSDKNITVHNIPGVKLPETGGTGTLWYLLIGISLIAISIKFGYKYIFNMKEGEV